MEKCLLILDLDETIIFAEETEPAAGYDFRCGHYYVRKRPHLNKFITDIFKLFEVAIWSSSSPDYAKCIVQNIFGDGELKFVWAQERCTIRYNHETRSQYWVKDLKKVKRKGFSLERVIMIDDTPAKLQRQYGNLVRVLPFTGEEPDDELIHLLSYLTYLNQQSNVRVVEKRGWKRLSVP